MKKKLLLLSVLLTMTTALFAQKPNIIVVYTDDISARELPIYGSDTWSPPLGGNTSDPQYRAVTPVLDKMATEGCYIETAWAATICSPSRAMMMTGRYAHLHKWWVNGDIGTFRDPVDNKVKRMTLPDSSPKTIGVIAKEGGYDTFWAGKTQMNDVDKLGFDEAVFTAGGDELSGRSPYTSFGLQNVGGVLTNLDSGNAPDSGETSTYPQNSWYWKTSASTMKKNASGTYDYEWWTDNENGNDTDVNTYGPDVELDLIFEFMERKKGENKPFFIYHTSHLGHDAYDYLTDGNVSRWPGTPKVSWDGTKYTRTTPNITGSNGVYNTNGTVTESGIHTHVNYLDYQMSLYLDKLKELGVENNTLIIFTSDNGTSGFGKSNAGSQRGTHVPFIIYGPGLGITKTGKQDVLLNISDVLPTIAEVAGVEIPCDYKINGESFWPFLTTAETTHRDWIYAYQGEKQIIRNQKVMIDGNESTYDVRTAASDLTSFTRLATSLPTTLADADLESNKNELLSIMTEFDLHATQHDGLPDASLNGTGCVSDTDDVQVTSTTIATSIGTDGSLVNPIKFRLTNIPNGTANVVSVRVYPKSEDVTLGEHVANFQLNSAVDINSNTADSNTANYEVVTQVDTPKVGAITRDYTINSFDLLTGKTITEGQEYVIAFRIVQGGTTGSSPVSHYTESGIQPSTGAGSTANSVFELNTLTAICAGENCVSSDMSVTFNNAASIIKTDGTLTTPMVFTVHSIPNSTSTAINIRLYPENADVTTGGYVAQFSNSTVNINSNTSDSSVANSYEVVTQANTPSVGYITRTYTINKLAVRNGSTINNGANYVAALRFVGGSSLDFSTTEGVQRTTGSGNANNVVMKLNTLEADDTLSTSKISKKNISSNITYSPLTSILYINGVDSKTYKIVNFLGQVLKEQKATGSINVSDLSGGVYFIVTDSGSAKFVK